MIGPVQLDSSICVTTSVMERPAQPATEAGVVGEQSRRTERERGVKVPAKRAAATNSQSAVVDNAQQGNGDCDSATQTDSATLTDGGNEAREREVEANSSPSRPQTELRDRKRQRVSSERKAGPGKALQKESGAKENKTSVPAAPFTLARAAQAAGVWNRAASKAHLPKMPTMNSATETREHFHVPDAAKGHTVPFEGSVGDIILQDNTEHAEQLHQESGSDAVVHARSMAPAAENNRQQNTAQQPDPGGSSSASIPAETLKNLLQTCAKGGQLSVHDLLRAVQQSGQGRSIGDEVTHATHTSNISTIDSFSAPGGTTQSCDNMQPPAPRAPPVGTRSQQGAAAAAPTLRGDASESVDLPGVSANARSLFLQLSDTGAVTADKSALERTATPIVQQGSVSGGKSGTMVTPQMVPQASGRRGGVGSSGGGAHSLTAPMPSYRQVMGHGVPVSTAQRSKSDLLNNPESRNALWFPEKAPRTTKGGGKSRFPSNSKKAADHPRAGILPDRSIPGGVEGAKTLSGQPVQSGLTDSLQQGKPGQTVTSTPAGKVAAQAGKGAVDPVTPEKVAVLLSLVSQLAVFADGGIRGRWCAAIMKSDCPGARALFRKAMDLQAAGTAPQDLAPLLQTQSTMPASAPPPAASPGQSGPPQIPAGLRDAVAAAAAPAPEAKPPTVTVSAGQ